MRTPPSLDPMVREVLMKERATLIDRLTHLESRLGLPSSLKTKEERRAEVYRPPSRRDPLTDLVE